MLLHENFQFIVLVIGGDIRFEYVPVSSPNQAYKLWSEVRSVNISKTIDRITCRGAERPNVCGSTPSHLEMCLGASKYRCSDNIALHCISGILRYCTSTIGQLRISKSDIPGAVVH